jgi:hypothetical protein
MKFFAMFSVMLLTLFLSQMSQAQGQESLHVEMPSYLDLNRMNHDAVTDVATDVLGLQYLDAYGQSRQITLKIFDWRRTQVAELKLTKSKGQNRYVLKLDEILVGREIGKIYSFSFVDEVNKAYQFSIRFAKAPEKHPIDANIYVNPKYVHCTEDLEGNLVEFYGNTARGKAPYVVTWYVLNESRTKFLYQPKEQRLARPGVTPSILVDKAPDYYVIMSVVDACGSEQHQVVHLQCDDGQKKVNTVFFESIQEFKNIKPIQ